MNRLTPEECLKIVEIYFKNQCSVKNVFHALRPFYGVHNCPTERTIRETINPRATNASGEMHCGAVYGQAAPSDRISLKMLKECV